MNLRLPGSGSMFEALLDSPGRTVADLTGATVVSSVSEEQLARALDALERGEIEYVILEDGEAFLQAAGEGAGPYAVQFSPGSGGDLIEIGRAADAAAMRETLRRYRRGDPAWRIG
jgi:hypothetical protein